jgi:Putative regulator of cell autolysis
MLERVGFVKRWPRSYAFILISGTLLITILFIVIYNALNLKDIAFWYMVASCIVSTLVTWFGSGYISMLFTRKINVFVHPVRLLSLLSISLIIYSTIIVLIELAVVERIYHYNIDRAMKIISIVIAVLITLFITAVHSSYYFFISWKANMLKAEKLEKENLQAQYETLKTQVNPHFVFNSLNTLLTMVECNPDAVKYVESLSDFLRYVLQTRDKEVVMLRDELTITNQYLIIQKGRFGEKLKILMDVPEAYYHYAIPPLALQMLLENAIKHNVISKDNVLDIRVYIEEKSYLVVENKINRKQEIENSTGIGLNNIRNRYLFLSGKEVKISEENGIFRVSLPLVEYSL